MSSLVGLEDAKEAEIITYLKSNVWSSDFEIILKQVVSERLLEHFEYEHLMMELLPLTETLDGIQMND